MKKCPNCAAEVSELQTTCPACGSSVLDPAAETEVLPADPQANTPTRLEHTSKRNKTPLTTTGTGGRFIAGTVLAGRYRIIGLIGKGGMGEVYKADDLELEQPVALKFLPEDVGRDEDLLKRFRGEVRNARQVSHANVCRVFDIGETEGLYYITMEYIDGDDLSMLLKRIGRLPSDKAIEVSRQICLGLGAIHKAGILHRDLKPSNIIIDSNGEARITDFGIAGLEMEVQGTESRVGTPAYMSPEQIDGKEVTQQSDIYSLGLLLYEIFTGKQAFIADNVIDLIRKQQTETPTNPSDLVRGIDPLVESTINQCLEKDPKDRPQSALHVAMALPGGNPLQIALDAGQTPSPEMVAASPKKGALRPVVAFSLLAAIIAGIGLMMATSKRTFLHRMIPLDKSEDILRERARELVDRFGYTGSDAYSAFGCPCSNQGYVNYLKENDQTPQRWEKLSSGQPATVTHWFRSSPEPLVPTRGTKVAFSDPENTVPGMARIRLDTKGRLLSFSGVPSRIDGPAPATGEFDWAAVLKDAGFEAAVFQPVVPQWTPPTAFDDRRAFSGSYPDNGDIAIRIEAASYRGKLISFEIIEPWDKPPGQGSDQNGTPVFAFVLVGIYFGVLFFSTWLSVRHVKAGRSDLKGALQVTVFMFSARMVMWVFATHHVASADEVNLLITGLQSALYWTVMAGVMYLAFEPYLRRSAPERIISWTRLLSGAWRDPLIGRDILIGAAIGILANSLWDAGLHYIPLLQGKPVPGLNIISSQGPTSAPFVGISGFPDLFFDKLTESLITAFIISFLIVFFGILLRRKWLGVAVVCMVALGISIASGVSQQHTVLQIVGAATITGAYVLTTARFGVVAVISMLLFGDIGNRPVTTELSAWYASEFVLYAMVLLGLTFFGFYTSTAGQKLWQVKLLREVD